MKFAIYKEFKTVPDTGSQYIDIIFFFLQVSSGKTLLTFVTHILNNTLQDLRYMIHSPGSNLFFLL